VAIDNFLKENNDQLEGFMLGNGAERGGLGEIRPAFVF